MNMHSLNVVAPWSESLAAIARNIGAANGTAVDTNFANGVRANYSVGDVNTTGTIAIKIQDSADNSSWADVTGATTGVLSAAGSACRAECCRSRRPRGPRSWPR